MNGSYVFQDKKYMRSESYGNLTSLFEGEFRKFYEYIEQRFNRDEANLKKNIIISYIKIIVKQFTVCELKFPGDLSTGFIDEALSRKGTNHEHLFII